MKYWTTLQKLMWLKRASGGSQEYEGDIVTFTTPTAKQLKNLIVSLSPIQSLNGYDSPWPAGGGKNLLKPAADRTVNEVAYTNNSDGSATVNGTATGAAIFYYYQNSGEIPFDTEGTWTLSGMNSTITGECYIQATVCNKSDDSIHARRRITPSSPTLTFTVTSEQYISDIFLRLSTGSSATNAKIYPMLEKGSTATSFAPYSNLCPITGRTGASAYLGAEHDPDTATLFSVDWTDEAGTVYSGTVDIVTGELTVDMVSRIVDGNNNWVASPGYVNRFTTTVSEFSDASVNYRRFLSNYLATSAWGTTKNTFAVRQTGTIYVTLDPDATQMTADEFKAFLNSNPLQLVYELATPLTFQLSPQQVMSLVGQNVVWSPDGSVKVRV